MAFRPFEDTQFSLGNLQDEMNKLFERLWHAGVAAGPFDGQKWAPFLDLHEYADRYVLCAEVPGVEADEVDVTHVGNTLTIRGEKVKPDDLADSDRALRNERRFGGFCRSVELPGDIDAERLSAKCQGGVLTITIPKSETSRPRAVKIDVEE